MGAVVAWVVLVGTACAPGSTERGQVGLAGVQLEQVGERASLRLSFSDSEAWPVLLARLSHGAQIEARGALEGLGGEAALPIRRRDAFEFDGGTLRFVLGDAVPQGSRFRGTLTLHLASQTLPLTLAGEHQLDVGQAYSGRSARELALRQSLERYLGLMMEESEEAGGWRIAAGNAPAANAGSLAGARLWAVDGQPLARLVAGHGEVAWQMGGVHVLWLERGSEGIEALALGTSPAGPGMTFHAGAGILCGVLWLVGSAFTQRRRRRSQGERWLAAWRGDAALSPAPIARQLIWLLLAGLGGLVVDTLLLQRDGRALYASLPVLLVIASVVSVLRARAGRAVERFAGMLAEGLMLIVCLSLPLVALAALESMGLSRIVHGPVTLLWVLGWALLFWVLDTLAWDEAQGAATRRREWLVARGVVQVWAYGWLVRVTNGQHIGMPWSLGLSPLQEAALTWVLLVVSLTLCEAVRFQRLISSNVARPAAR